MKHFPFYPRWIISCVAMLWGVAFAASAEEAPKSPLPFFFDADTTGINRDLNRQTFDGNVVAIGGGTIITGDHIAFDRAKNSLIVSGHIFVVHLSNPYLTSATLNQLSGVMFTGESLNYSLGTGDFVMTQAVMVAQDPNRLGDIVQQVFGFTRREIDFEVERQKRLEENNTKRQNLRLEAIKRFRKEKIGLSEDLVDRYALLIEQEELIKAQDNPTFGQLDPDLRDRLKARREHWELTRQAPLKQPRFSSMHFRIEGGELVRTDETDYVAYDALITPCRCEEGESPAWAFRARSIDAQMGGYADLKHPILEIKGVPVLYLPVLSIPLKDERQSGFLLPSMGFETRSGNIFSQPIYFAIDEKSDATVTADVFEKRGTRLGLQYRVEQREHAGWHLSLDAIRDQLWLKDRALRQEIGAIYNDGLEYALLNEKPPEDLDYEKASSRDLMRYQLLDRSYWEKNILGAPLTPESAKAFQRDTARYLAIPDNAWRGSMGWGGVTFFSPRLSIASSGQINSDHRYVEDLYVPANYQEAFFGGRDSRAFTPARVQIHADGKDFYAGVGASLGDNHLLKHRFEGQQLPQRLKIQSRTISLLSDSSLIPAYGQVAFESLGIREYKPPGAVRLDAGGPDGEPLPTLGDGNWQRLKLDQVSPLYPDGRIQVSQFSDVEQRQIRHGRLKEKQSSIRSYRFGLEFRLPIDGKGALPRTFQDETKQTDITEPTRENFVHHLMDWRLRFSSRPVVVKDGLYTNESRASEGGDLAYFAGDRVVNPNSAIDNDVPEEERMKIHRRVSLSTEHLVRLFRKSWSLLPGKTTFSETSKMSRSTMTKSQLRAREELLSGLGLPVKDPDQMIDRTTGQWSIDRYALNEEIYASPLVFRANVAYDFLDAEKREKERKSLRDLDQEISRLEGQLGPESSEVLGLKSKKKAFILSEPWKNPNMYLQLNHQSYTLALTADYSLYLRTTTAFSSALGLPPFWGQNLGFGYSVGKEYLQAEEDFRVTTQRSVSLASSLTPSLSAQAAWARKLTDGQEETFTNSIRTAVGFNYSSPTQCWGLQGVRVKEFGIEERDASYTLQFSLVFMGQGRSLPNMSSAVMKELRDDKGSPQS